MSFILETKNFKIHVQKINKSVDLKKRSKKQALLAQYSYEIFSPPITLTLNTCLSGVIYPIRFERWLKKIHFCFKGSQGLRRNLYMHLHDGILWNASLECR